jgi:hypothetical protein
MLRNKRELLERLVYWGTPYSRWYSTFHYLTVTQDATFIKLLLELCDNYLPTSLAFMIHIANHTAWNALKPKTTYAVQLGCYVCEASGINTIDSVWG